MFDLVIRNAMIIDGTGASPAVGDVAVRDGVIVGVGSVSGSGTREIDATGLALTPGFVDIHTHYDGQVTWDPHLSPSCYHGVTTVVFGNCGVGFAPVRPDQHEYLVSLMEAVEDIPGTALSEGINWQWETFPDYLDALDSHPLSIDVGTQVPHGAVRTYVMGERGANNEPATPEDIAAMAAIVKEGISAGALGFSTSRTIVHRAASGDPMPGTFAAEDELFGIGRVLGELGTGIFELAPAGVTGEDLMGARQEMDWMKRLSAEIGRPVSFAMLQVDTAPTLWREQLQECADAVDDGADLYPQMAGRPFGMLIGHQTDMNPFRGRPSYDALDPLPFDERVRRLAEPAVRTAILDEKPGRDGLFGDFFTSNYDRLFPLGWPLDYEPGPDRSVAAVAEREGRDAEEALYDILLEREGRELLLFPILNYADGNCDPLYEMLHHPRAALGLGDGGAHCGIICDASIQTFMLSHWVRDRTRGPRIPVELAVKRMTSDTAVLYGLGDRGRIEVGYKADLNLIDLDDVQLEVPEMVFDLPAGGRRLIQKARGYKHTFVNGVEVMTDGEPTDARPGALIRGSRPAPVA